MPKVNLLAEGCRGAFFFFTVIPLIFPIVEQLRSSSGMRYKAKHSMGLTRGSRLPFDMSITSQFDQHHLNSLLNVSQDGCGVFLLLALTTKRLS